MYNGQTVSLKEILYQVFRHPYSADLNYDDAASSAIDCLDLLGIPLGYKSHITDPPIKINEYKGLAPKNIITIRGIKLINHASHHGGIALLHDTDIYGHNDCNEFRECSTRQGYTYTIQGGIIKTSFEKGDVIISYKGLDLDKDGFPNIPDNPKVKKAVHYYVLYQHIEPLYDIGKITDKAFQRISQEKDWYMGASQSSMQIQNMDHAESIANSIKSLIINDRAHENFYANLSTKENIKPL